MFITIDFKCWRIIKLFSAMMIQWFYKNDQSAHLGYCIASLHSRFLHGKQHPRYPSQIHLLYSVKERKSYITCLEQHVNDRSLKVGEVVKCSFKARASQFSGVFVVGFSSRRPVSLRSQQLHNVIDLLFLLRNRWQEQWKEDDWAPGINVAKNRALKSSKWWRRMRATCTLLDLNILTRAIMELLLNYDIWIWDSDREKRLSCLWALFLTRLYILI